MQAGDWRLLLRGDGTGRARRTDGGGYREEHVPLGDGSRYRLAVREEPRPLTAGTEGWRFFRRHRVRNRLSAWFLRDRVELPLTEEQRRLIAARVTADPEQVLRERDGAGT